MRRITVLIALALFFAGCKKNGAGGNATISGQVLHHSKPIALALIYVKYDAREFPGADISLYDTQVQADAVGNYSFACYKGDYFLYAKGTDLLNVPVEVDGGVPVKVRAKEMVKADIVVSEVH